MDNTSLWKKISTPVDYPPLTKDINIDVAIIGGGITGITAALYLINAGKKVAILEAENIGGVTTGFSTGNLYIPIQPYYQNIIKRFNLDTAKIIAQSRQFAIDHIEKNVREYNINCNFARRPWYAYADNDKKIPTLEKEIAAFKSLGIAVNYIDELPLPFKFKKAAVMENQARFNPLQYVISIAEILSKNGCLIFEKTRVTAINEKDVCTLTTSTPYKVIAKKVIMATHTPIGINTKHFFTAPYRSYVVAIPLKENVHPEGHLWDFDHSYHASTHPISANHPELLMLAGCHHKVGQGGNMEAHYEELKIFLRKRFPTAKIAYKWSAQHYQTADDLPYIGLASRFSKHTYMATGYFADGLVYGTIAGVLMSDLTLGKNNLWAKVYNSNRFTLGSSAAFVAKENINNICQYYRDIPTFTKDNLQELRPGDAKIIDIDREKWGVYKDDKQLLHIVSAVCPHMKCLVNWNNAEKTWDCPCHGSRFNIDGIIIEGPATTNLKKRS